MLIYMFWFVWSMFQNNAVRNAWRVKSVRLTMVMVQQKKSRTFLLVRCKIRVCFFFHFLDVKRNHFKPFYSCKVLYNFAVDQIFYRISVVGKSCNFVHRIKIPKRQKTESFKYKIIYILSVCAYFETFVKFRQAEIQSI